MIKISICDDEISFCKSLEQMLMNYAHSYGISIDIKMFTSSFCFLDSYSPDTDIVFLDILMPLQNGLSVAKELRKKDPNVCLIFLTSLRQYVFKGYDFQAYQYILKPITARRIELLMNELIPKIRQDDRQYIFVKVKGDVHRIDISDLIYIETQSRKALLHLFSGTLLVNKKLQDFENVLPQNSFFRCQASFIVNLAYIKDITGYQIYLTTDDVVPISKQKKRTLLEHLALYLGGEII